MEACAGDDGVGFGLPDLLKFHGNAGETAVVPVEGNDTLVPTGLAHIVFEGIGRTVARVYITECDIPGADEGERVVAEVPGTVPTDLGGGLVAFLDAKSLQGVVRIVALQEIAGFGVEVGRLEQEIVGRACLNFHGGAQGEFVGVVIEALADAAGVEGVEGIGEVVLLPELGGALEPIAVSCPRSGIDESEPVVFEEPRVFVVRDGLGKGSGADRGQQIGEKEFAVLGGLVAEVNAARIVAVGEEQVGGGVGVVSINRVRRFAKGDLRKAGVVVELGKIRAAHGTILVEAELGSEKTAVVIATLGLVKVLDRRIDLVALLMDEGGVEPGGGVVGIQRLGQRQLVKGAVGKGGDLEEG